MTEDQESETIANPPPDPPGPGGGLRPKPFSSYRRQALAQSNSLLASIRLLNCDLMEIAHRYHCAVKKVIREAPPDLKKLDAVGPALQDCLQLNRQIDRYTQLDLQLQARMVPADAHA